MRRSWADAIWSTMNKGAYYSAKDLANLSGEAGCSVTEVINFLTKYGFVQRVGSNEPVYTKTDMDLSPAESISMLKQLVTAKTA
ncbi:MAG TPA: hypothetical protein VJZ75_00010 [Candidatus Bathyarchaeia archaeon]|nr:hypothetical protein [Candidatus Bathyarchaeia archaeon]